MPWARENDFNDLIAAEAGVFQLDPALVKAIIAQESRFQPGATHADAGGHFSAGLMQVEDTTFTRLNYDGPEGDATSLTGYWDPGTSVHYGCLLLSQLMRQVGNIPDAVSAYNGGVRPALGFGRVAAAPVVVCLQRAPDGGCARWREVAVGEYGNQDYVVRVLSNLTYFRQQAAALAGAGALVPGASVTFTPTLLTIAVVIGLLWWLFSKKGPATRR